MDKKEMEFRALIAERANLKTYMEEFLQIHRKGVNKVTPKWVNDCYLGIDQSYRSTGVVVMDDNCKLIHQEVMHVPEKSKAGGLDLQGYEDIWRFVAEILGYFRPKAVFLEDMFVGANQKSAVILFRVQFVVEYVTWLMGIPFHRVRPMAWQRFIIGPFAHKLTGVKKVMARDIMERDLNIKFKSEHVSDAAGILLTGMATVAGRDFRDILDIPVPPKEYMESPTARQTRKKTKGAKNPIIPVRVGLTDGPTIDAITQAEFLK